MSKYRHRTSFAIAVLVILGFVVSSNAAPKPKAIAWQTNYQKALALASSQKKIVMIDFYSEG